MNGALGQFAKAEQATEAVKRARGSGPWKVEAYSPFPVEELAHAVDETPERLPAIVFVGGALGLCGALLLQEYASVFSYPLNIGGRPLNSWPAFVPVCFELTVLLASLSAVFGLIALSGLPRLNHPLFEVEAFKAASRDKFFVWLVPQDGYDDQRARALLKQAGAEQIHEVP